MSVAWDFVTTKRVGLGEAFEALREPLAFFCFFIFEPILAKELGGLSLSLFSSNLGVKEPVRPGSHPPRLLLPPRVPGDAILVRTILPGAGTYILRSSI